MSASIKNPIQKFESNKLGRDFVVGDLHGRFDLILKYLKTNQFNMDLDRLFCVGDLIDRGQYSSSVLEFLELPFVYTIRGNHEDMLLEFYELYPNASDNDFVNFGYQNGMLWFVQQPLNKRKEILNKLKELPLIIEIESERGLIGLVHADVPLNLSWNDFKNEVLNGNQKVIETALWGRKRLTNEVVQDVDGLGRLFVGHTVQNNIKKLGNVVAIDTGAVFNQQLSIVNTLCCTNVINEKTKEPLKEILLLDNQQKQKFSKLKK